MNQWDNIQFQYTSTGLQTENKLQAQKQQDKTISVPNRAIHKTSSKNQQRAAVADIIINVGVLTK